MRSVIPDELRRRQNWIVWSAEQRPDGKLDKRPHNPATGDMARSNDPSTWGTYEQAVNAWQRNGARYAGIGYMFDGSTFGVDIDGCFDRAGKILDPNVPHILAMFGSYAETSPSGTGLHILCAGTLPEDKGRRRGHYEIYGKGRFFTVTCRRYGDVRALRECTVEAKEFIARYIDVRPPRKPKQPAQPNQATTTAPIGAGAAIPAAQIKQLRRRIAAGKSGDMFKRLWDGDAGAYGGDASVADLALCNIIAPWVDGDEALLDAMFRASGLYRPKWDEKRGAQTYGEMTIAKAFDGTTNTTNTTNSSNNTNATNGFNGSNADTAPIYGYTDQDNARRMFRAHGQDLRYCANHDKWYIWTGTHWAVDWLQVRDLLADKLVEQMRAEAMTSNSKVRMKGADSSAGTNRRKNMIKDLQHYKEVAIIPAQMDVDPMLFAAQNGTIDLRTGEITPHRREDMITRISPVDCDYSMPTPEFDAFISRIMGGDMEMVGYVQRAAGYSMTGSTAEQCLFLCLGNGANGKSTLFDALAHVLGGYVANVQPETLMSRKSTRDGSGAQADIARLANVRFVTMEEPDEGIRMNESLVKQVTGSGSITARHLYGDFFEFRPIMKIWLGANHEPIITGTDDGIWRRIQYIPFGVQIPVDERDGDLLDKLKAEAPGILAWCVRGAMEWAKNGLQAPEKVKVATMQYREGMDLMKAFLDECTIEDAGGSIPAKAMYDMYVRWANENEYKPLTGNAFGRELSKRVKRVRMAAGNVYMGVSKRLQVFGGGAA